MQFYVNPKNHQQVTNCAAFETFMRRFEQPNPEKAPWHVQCRVPSIDGCDKILNFWPHKLQGQYDGKAVVGLDALRGMMAKAIDDSHEEPFDVIEGAA